MKKYDKLGDLYFEGYNQGLELIEELKKYLSN